MNAFARVLCVLLLAGPAAAAVEFPGEVAGHAVLPATTWARLVDDVPASLRTSGRFTGPQGRRSEPPASLPAFSFGSHPSAPRPTGTTLPLAGQPVQGLSGLRWRGAGRALAVSDNGFGARSNSADALLMVHHLRIDWRSRHIAVERTVVLRDPDRRLPFPIVNEHTIARHLTGADLDPESIQPIGETLWIGDEFGPWLVQFDADGRLLSIHETQLDGRPLRSPDHPAVRTPDTPGPVAFEVRRSRGFEGMAASRDGRHLYPMLEAALVDAGTGPPARRDAPDRVLILEFDVVAARWTGRRWSYRLEHASHAIGDFNLLDDGTALVVERDGGEGDPARACDGPPRVDCFHAPARFKRVYRIDLGATDPDGSVVKIGWIDLLRLHDPHGHAAPTDARGVFTFPFVTIEGVDAVDRDHLVVGNDNNLPFSSARRFGAPDDNELVLIRAPAFLRPR